MLVHENEIEFPNRAFSIANHIRLKEQIHFAQMLQPIRDQAFEVLAQGTQTLLLHEPGEVHRINILFADPPVARNNLIIRCQEHWAIHYPKQIREQLSGTRHGVF